MDVSQGKDLPLTQALRTQCVLCRADRLARAGWPGAHVVLVLPTIRASLSMTDAIASSGIEWLFAPVHQIRRRFQSQALLTSSSRYVLHVAAHSAGVYTLRRRDMIAFGLDDEGGWMVPHKE